VDERVPDAGAVGLNREHAPWVTRRIRDVLARCDLAIDMTAEQLQAAWSTLIRAGGTVSRNYLHHLIERIDVADDRITIVPRPTTSV